jgi:hypothetical protein
MELLQVLMVPLRTNKTFEKVVCFFFNFGFEGSGNGGENPTETLSANKFILNYSFKVETNKNLLLSAFWNIFYWFFCFFEF